MRYPTQEDVDKATRRQLGIWYRFLPSPGYSGIGLPTDAFHECKQYELRILERIIARFKNEFGGWDSELSRSVGWDENFTDEED